MQLSKCHFLLCISVPLLGTGGYAGDSAARFEKVPIPAGTYIIFETERCEFPAARMGELRMKAISEWLPTSGCELRDAPGIGVIHWF